jgi:hypothetical protein
MNILDKIAMGIVRGYLNNAIGGFTSDELRVAIEENSDLWSVTPTWLKNASGVLKSNYGKSFQKYFDEQVNTELILTWLSYDQPALFRVFRPNPFQPTNSKEFQWLDNQVKKIKEEVKKL